MLASMSIGPAPFPPATPATAEETFGFDPAFDRDKFLLRQKHLSLSAKYTVSDEEGNPILFVIRPVHALRTIAALLAAVTAFFVVAAGMLAALLATCNALGVDQDASLVIALSGGIIGGLIASILLAIRLGPKRHVLFKRSETDQAPLMRVLQEQKFTFLVARYTVIGEAGEPLAHLRKNYLYNLFRKRWECRNPYGELVCLIQEDSLLKALLRRFLGSMYGLLRTNYVLLRPGAGPEAERRLGAFNRRFTLLDRYVLDLTPDPAMELDRRVALAIGVMLDTGERR